MLNQNPINSKIESSQNVFLQTENIDAFAEAEHLRREIDLLINKSTWDEKRKEAWHKVIRFFTADYLRKLKDALVHQKMGGMQISSNLKKFEVITKDSKRK